MVEHFLGKEEVDSSILFNSSFKLRWKLEKGNNLLPAETGCRQGFRSTVHNEFLIQNTKFDERVRKPMLPMGNFEFEILNLKSFLPMGSVHHKSEEGSLPRGKIGLPLFRKA